MTAYRFNLVREWMEAFLIEHPDTGALPMVEGLVSEEYQEFIDAIHNDEGRAAIIKEAGDLIWVVKKYLILMGVDPDVVEGRIHHSNMSKLDANSDPIYREDGKILKGPFYVAPDMEDL